MHGLNEHVGGGYFKQTAVFDAALFRQSDAAEGAALFESIAPPVTAPMVPGERHLH
jgi:hypothetical protein